MPTTSSFQSTPAHDGRQARAPQHLPSEGWFQSTPAHDGRREVIASRDPAACVSIHARTRRATAAWVASRGTWWCFNPRPHTTGDAARAIDETEADMFQSTPAHDGRLFPAAFLSAAPCFNPRPHTTGDVGSLVCSSESHCFNPRPHTTGDGVVARADIGRRVSIHARTRRATSTQWHSPGKHIVSIHARTRRATATTRLRALDPHVSIHARTRRATIGRSLGAGGAVFQSTPAHDGRLHPGSLPRRLLMFQSTPAHDGRRLLRRKLGLLKRVSIHARTRRATGDQTIKSVPPQFQSTPAHDGRR